MKRLTLKELAVPMIESIDSFNYLLKSHHRRVAIISYNLGKELGLHDKSLSNLVVAASLHDIGALSIQERDMLIKEDVSNPTPHCEMGYKMLSSFEVFEDISKIIKHHHVKYSDYVNQNDNDEIPFESCILHLADRIDILINTNGYILNQTNDIVDKIEKKVGKVFHHDVFKAFKKLSESQIFWLDINNISMGELLNKIDFSLDLDLDLDKIVEFSLTISRIIDFRSKFTASHSYTVGHLASFIGSLFDYDEEICKKLEIAGYLHDIGKIGINPELIEKNGKLTDEEYSIMKLHPYYTGQILSELSSSDWFKDIVYWAKNHHEKNDGSGYPNALKDFELDKPAKILAYADVLTALLEDRPYRKGLEVDEALNIISKDISSKLSTEMFDKIKPHKNEIKNIVKESQEYRKSLNF